MSKDDSPLKSASVSKPLSQLVYLDFDGELTQYRNDELGIRVDVEVKDSGFTEDQKEYILLSLSRKFADTGVVFTIDKPQDTEDYSTVFIGQTDAFKQYGGFTGLAETIDKGNKKTNDNAFVLTDDRTSPETVISVAAHEVGHIVLGQEHENQTGTLQDYADRLISQTTDSLSVSVRRSGGQYPGRAYAETKSWTAAMPAGADYANVTITNDGVTSSYGWNSRHTNVTVKYNGNSYTINPGNSINLKVTSNATISITRDAYLDLEVLNAINKSIYVGGIIGYKYVFCGYNYKSGYVTNKVSIKANYYSADVSQNPDLSFSSFTVSSSSVNASSAVSLRFTVRNRGKSSSSATTTYVYDGTKLLGSVKVAALAAGKSASYRYTIAAGRLSFGTHTLKIVADATSVISEPNERNNTATRTVKVTGPDLAFSSFKTSASTITASNTLTLKFKVRNKGKNKAAASRVYVYDGSKLLGSVKVKALAAGKSASCSYKIAAGKLSFGTHTLKIVADATYAVRETSESNNTATRTVKVTGPDLAFSFSATTSYKISSTSALTLKFTVRNLGRNKAAASKAYVYDGTKLLGSVKVAALAAGKSASYSYKIAAGKLGIGYHILNVVADATSAVKETNESNNKIMRTVTVTGPDLTISSFDATASKISTTSALMVKFTVRNEGEDQAAASTVSIYDDAKLLGSVKVAALAAGESASYSYTIAAGKLTTGFHLLKATADATSAVRESSEYNNNNYCGVRVTEPSLLTSSPASTLTSTVESVWDPAEDEMLTSADFTSGGADLLELPYAGNADTEFNLTESSDSIDLTAGLTDEWATDASGRLSSSDLLSGDLEKEKGNGLLATL